MKISYLLALSLFMSWSAGAQTAATIAKLKISGEPLPAISHVTDMKVSGDTLLFVYESEDGYGQRFLRRAVIDSAGNTLRTSSDIGKLPGGYFVSYMPYPFVAADGSIRVVGQDDCELYDVENDTLLIRTGRYLMGGNTSVPLPFSRYVQDVFMAGPDDYIFIGREPNGGRQYAVKADLTTAKTDTIRRIGISPELQTWIANTGGMAYSGKYRRMAFAYRLHPVLEIFRAESSDVRTIEIAEPTFDRATLSQADLESLNPLHFVDITATDDFIFALYWGHDFNSQPSDEFRSTIYKIDWDGNILGRFPMNIYLRNIAAVNNTILIGWTGTAFLQLPLTPSLALLGLLDLFLPPFPPNYPIAESGGSKDWLLHLPLSAPLQNEAAAGAPFSPGRHPYSSRIGLTFGHPIICS